MLYHRDIKFIVIGLVLLASGLSLAAQQQGLIQELGPKNAGQRLLLATEPTRFKDALIQEMVRLLNDGQTYILVVNHSRNGLNGIDPRQFSAVFISNSGATAQVRPWVLQFLDRVKDFDENIILHTTQTTVWTPPVKVDSLTSASDMGAVRRLAQEYVNRIKKFL